jgi:hypothetical protein
MTDTITPEVGKTYLTRDGRKARCICTDMQRSDGFPVICLVDNKDSQVTYYYMTNGRYRIDQSEGPLDLVSEAPRVVTLEVWVEMMPDGKVVAVSSATLRPASPAGTVVKITQDVELPAAPEVK